MSLQNVLSIINQAIDDAAFREQLLDHPEAVTRHVELTKAEKAMLANLRSGPYTSTRRGLIDVRKMIEASIEYGGQTPGPGETQKPDRANPND